MSPLSKIIWYINRIVFCVDIDYRADLAGGFVLVHGLGTVIGKGVVSEGNLRVYQHVTIGGNKQMRFDENGKKFTMPVLKNNVIIYTGATVVGAIVVGENKIVKAGQVISKDLL